MSDYGDQGISVPATFTSGNTKFQKLGIRALFLATASVMALQFTSRDAHCRLRTGPCLGWR